MALAVTQPYIGKAHIELIDSNTDPNFNQLLSAHGFLAQAQQALIKLTNPAAGVAQASGVNYLLPVYIANEKNIVPAQTTNRDLYKTNIDAAITSISSAIVNLYAVIADANS